MGTSRDRDVRRPRTDVAVDERGDPAQRVVAAAAGDLVERRRRRRAAARGRTPTRRSRRARARTPAARRRARRRGSCGCRAPRPTSSDPPSSSSTAGISAAGSACTREPTVVPRLRMVGCATWTSASAHQRLDPADLRARRARRCAGPARRRAPRRRVALGSRSRPGHRVDVDERRGRREPHRQQRDQALAAGQHLRVRARGQRRDAPRRATPGGGTRTVPASRVLSAQCWCVAVPVRGGVVLDVRPRLADGEHRALVAVLRRDGPGQVVAATITSVPSAMPPSVKSSVTGRTRRCRGRWMIARPRPAPG